MSMAQPGLLERLRQHGEQAAWERLVDLYSPHLFLWACRSGLPGAAAGELVRRVFDAVARKLPEFSSDWAGGFRAWMRLLAHEQRRELLQNRNPINASDTAVVPAAADALWGEEYLPLLLRTAIDVFQADLPAQEWKACQGLTMDGRPAADVARELAMPEAAVYGAEFRVLQRLRQELDGLLDP
jgi:RNA polymerase sigma-70 factor (ECF subfamily)